MGYSAHKPDTGWSTERLAGLFFVIAAHLAAVYALAQAELLPAPQEAATLFVNFIAPPPPPEVIKKTPPPPSQPKPAAPQPRQLVAAALPTDKVPTYVAPPPVIEAPVAPPAPAPQPSSPVNLGTELAIACSERPPPAYPAISRRMGETGKVILRVELDEQGKVAQATVEHSSHFPRLDEAALQAVRNWQCTPPTRNGRPVRGMALQPFNFVLQGS